MKKSLNLKRLLKKRNNGGFTLIEVIISVALLGILMMGITMFISPILNTIKLNKKNARATMLAETLDSYISGSLKNAKYVLVVTNTTQERMTTVGATGITYAQDTIIPFMRANSDDYEVRCLGINWVEEKSSSSDFTGNKKLMITNRKVDNNFSSGYNNQLVIIPATSETERKREKVFDDSLYSLLYPVIDVETFKAQNPDGSEADANAKGYKISAKIYSDPACYNVISDAAREKSYLAFEGVTYAQCANMTTPASDVVPLATTQAAIDSRAADSAYANGGNNYYYPDTFIYYVVPK